MTELSMLVRVSIVLAVAIVGTRLSRRAPAAWRALVLTLAFAVVAALPFTAVLLPSLAVPVPVLRSSAPASQQRPRLQTPAAEGVTVANREPRGESAASPSVPAVRNMVRSAWVLGVFLSAWPLLLMLRTSGHIRRRARPWPTGRPVVASLARQAGLRRPIAIFLHEDLVVPMTSGLWRPAVFLPADAPAWNAADLRHALTHEIEHVRRGDWIVLLLARLVTALYWFHPLVWIAFRQLRLECERACDDGVVRQSDRTAYAEQLVALARRVSSRAIVPLVPMAHRNDLTRRVAAILDLSQRRGPVAVHRARLAIAFAGALLWIISSIQPVATAAKPSRAQSSASALTGEHADLIGTVYDPLGAPVADIVLFIESGPFGSGVYGETRTDKDGRYAFRRLPPGVYTISAPIDFAPSADVTLEAGQQVRHDIRMRLEAVTGIFSVCVDCDPAPVYTPPASLVNEFALDRVADGKRPVSAPEPAIGWEYYQPDVRLSDATRARVQTGTVVLEGRVDADGRLRDVVVTSSPDPELATAALTALEHEKWRPGSIHGVPTAMPLRMTIEFLRRGNQR